MRRRTAGAAMAGAVAIGAAAIGIAIGATSGASPDQELSEVSPRVPTTASAQTLPSDVAPRSANTLLSPESSLAGRAVAAVLPQGDSVKAVQAVRSGTANYDLVDARRGDGSGLEVNLWRTFASDELDAAVAPVPTGGGRYWPAADDAQIQSVYYQSASGVAVRVAHYSSPSGARLSRPDLVSFAARLVDALTSANGGTPPEARPVEGVR